MLGILVAVLAAGCAGGEALSKEQYVSKLNAMCREFSAKEKEIGEPQTLADLVERGPRILDEFEKSIVDKVGTLKAPDEIADQADRLVDSCGPTARRDRRTDRLCKGQRLREGAWARLEERDAQH